MHDARRILQDPEAAEAALARRGYRLDTAFLTESESRRRSLQAEIDAKRREAKDLSRQIGRRIQGSGGDDPELQHLRERSRELRDAIQDLEERMGAVKQKLHEHLLTIPNIPSERCPEGLDESAAREVRREGQPPSLEGSPLDHADLGESLDILDFRRGAKLSGSRFSVSKGAGARLERALAAFLLDLHAHEQGYTEVAVPALVTRETMTGTGQLPKFEADLFKTGVSGRELFLVPTAEVPVTNLHAGEILGGAQLPVAYVCLSPCFRSEAGDYGRDTRGLIRQHQFHKVELVRLCREEESWDQLQLMLGHAEEGLRRLGLHYRVVELAAGDLAFAATFCYDIEVWLPSQERFREISSCSNCWDFQARRAGIRYRPAPKERPSHPHTLNGSALPIGRTLAALLECGQQPDGSVILPEALHPYTGFSRILPGGATE